MEKRQEWAAVNVGRAWLIVRKDQGHGLLDAVRELGNAWELHRVSDDSDPDRWVSVTFPRQDITAAAELLRRAPAAVP